MSDADNFQQLIRQLSSELSQGEADISQLQQLLYAYKSVRSQWQRFYFEHPEKYTRNLVDTGNGRYNLLLLVWLPGHGSAIHDHAGSHCLLKVLQGRLTETRFAWPEVEAAAPPLIGRTELERDSCTYMHDKIGLHRVANEDPVETAVSLHLYIPPYDRCRCYDADSGDSHEANVSFYSADGKIVFQNLPSAY